MYVALKVRPKKNRRQAQVRVGGGWMAHCVLKGGYVP